MFWSAVYSCVYYPSSSFSVDHLKHKVSNRYKAKQSSNSVTIIELYSLFIIKTSVFFYEPTGNKQNNPFNKKNSFNQSNTKILVILSINQSIHQKRPLPSPALDDLSVLIGMILDIINKSINQSIHNDPFLPSFTHFSLLDRYPWSPIALLRLLLLLNLKKNIFDRNVILIKMFILICYSGCRRRRRHSLSLLRLYLPAFCQSLDPAVV